jgi:hypothetical protein
MKKKYFRYRIEHYTENSCDHYYYISKFKVFAFIVYYWSSLIVPDSDHYKLYGDIKGTNFENEISCDKLKSPY